MLYADDLCLTANRPDQLQAMLNRLDEYMLIYIYIIYAWRKGLPSIPLSLKWSILTHGFNVPAFSVGGAPLANKDSFKYLGNA